MLLTKKKFSAPGQKLCVGRWLTTGVTAPNMCFNGFHDKVPPEFDVYSMNRANGLFNQMYFLSCIIPQNGVSETAVTFTSYIRQRRIFSI